jgi:hypothetical protein
MRLKQINFFFCIFIFSVSYGKTLDTLENSQSNNEDQTTVKPEPIKSLKKWKPVLWYNLYSGSNSLPLSFVSKFAFGGHIETDVIQSNLELLNTNNKIGYFQEYGMQLFPFFDFLPIDLKTNLRSIKLISQSMLGARFTKDAYSLFFQGNSKYLGKELNPANNKINGLNQRILKFELKSYNLPRYLGANFTVVPEIQFSQVLSYQSLQTNDLKFYSNNIGDSISLNGSMYSQNTGYDFWGTGYGIQLGFLFTKIFNSSVSLNFQISNFGFIFVNNANTLSRNVQFAENGLNVQNWNSSDAVNITPVKLSYSDLRGTNWFSRQRDTISSKLNFIESNRNGMILSPFFANLEYRKWFLKPGGNIVFLNVELDYRHILGYFPRLGIDLGKSFKLGKIPFNGAIGLSVGGFDTYDINANFNIIRGVNNFKFYVRGLESFVIPSKEHGGGFGVQLSYPFTQ